MIKQTDEQVGKILRLADELGEHNHALEFLRLCYTYKESQSLIDELELRIQSKTKKDVFIGVLNEIIQTLGTVNFSSHNQMREGVEGALSLAEEGIEKLTNE